MYKDMIAKLAKVMGVDVDPRHVEAWMRLEFGTLDARPESDFRAFIAEVPLIEAEEPGASESLAQSYAL